MKAIDLAWLVLLVIGMGLSSAGAQSASSTVYDQNCAACHQADGGGVPFMQPSFIESEFVSGEADALIEFVLLGSEARADQFSEYENVMAGFSFLEDADLAEVLNYIRGSFGNTGGPVSEAQVAEVRSRLDQQSAE